MIENKYRYSLHVTPQSSIYRYDSLLIGKPYQSGTEIWKYVQIYKNYSTDQWLKTSGAYIDGYGYQRKISELTKNNKFQWVKTGVEKEILGFKCVEVIDRKKTAYYAVDIPIPDGPKYGIFNLPGLVLDYEDEMGHWTAVAINYNVNSDILIPEVKVSTSESEIKKSVFDMKDLPASKGIRLDRTTAVNQWIKFPDE